MSVIDKFMALQPKINVRSPEETTGAEECSARWKGSQQILFSSILPRDRYWRDGPKHWENRKSSIRSFQNITRLTSDYTNRKAKGNYHNQYKLFTESLTVDVTENRHVDLLKPDENPCLFSRGIQFDFCLSSSANFLGHRIPAT